MKHLHYITAIAALSLTAGAALAAVPAYLTAAISDPARPAADTGRDVNRHLGE